MTTEITNSQTPTQKENSDNLEVQEQGKLDRIADKLSKRAEQSEQHNNLEHDIFTK